MKKFRTAIVNGYKKEAVDTYLEELEQEMERLQEGAQKGQAVDGLRRQLEEMEQENEKLKSQLRARTEALEAEIVQRKQLQQREAELQEEQKRLKEQNAKYAKDEEKLRKYESDYSGFMALMVNMKEQAKQIVTDAQADAEQILLMAKKDADGITAAARTDAEKIAEQAKNDAETSMQKAEADIEKMREEEAEKFKMARYKISGYLDSLNRSQNKLIEVYEEFGNIVDQLPLRIGDVFSEEAFELLDDPKRDENDGWMRPEEQAKEEAPYSSKD